MFYMVEMRSATQEKSFCTDLIPWSLPRGLSKHCGTDLQSTLMYSHWWGYLSNSAISFTSSTSSVFTGTPKRRILKECRVATPVHLFCSKVLSWLRLCLVYHTDICSYSALCSTLDFLIMGMEGIGMITVKIYQNWALLSRLLTTPLMFTLNFCSLELCSFCAAITFNTLCKSLIVVQKSLKVCPAPALAGSSSPDVKCLYYLHWILDGFVFLFL